MGRPTKEQQAAKAAAKKAAEGHVRRIDIDETGIEREVAVVKEWKNGSLSYIDINKLDNMDKSRLKTILSSVHAERYTLWELLSLAKLNNGMNALDYFHGNYIEHKRSKDALVSELNSGLKNAKVMDSVGMIGEGFVDPAEAQFDSSGPTAMFDS